MKDNTANIFSLFASSSTLICCALPSLFVAIGAGASFASLITHIPFLITLSYFKVQITLFAFIMISIAGYINYKTYHMPCPADPELGRLCMQTRKRSRILYYISVAIFLFATIFTYLAPYFL
ncbi:hypothetical protein OAQ75_02715 [Gammaproteobacteria bacterium]|jgi:hypothetical protein|nr:hypothetical protein [Gammaproteobacteria bacterium]MDC1021499.1 hypothetical protein [Gammaproteobacteria bacterium]